jgi:glutaminyl-peptide cyclotransferase
VIGAVTAVIAILAIARTRCAPREHGNGEGGRGDVAASSAPERLAVRVVGSYPHARDAFTQGLLWHDGHLYESTGLYGRSSLRRVDLQSGEVLERRALPPELFAEGLARVGDRLIQLTWQEHRAIVWTLDGLQRVREFAYEGEGWGLCYDGEHLVMSDGSDRLVFRDPETFRSVRSIRVRERGRPVDQLNELECVDGAIWANVWQTDRILRIDPHTGNVTGIATAGDLLDPDEREHADVLNGIAWIPERRHFVITGKLWPRLFEVEFVPET